MLYYMHAGKMPYVAEMANIKAEILFSKRQKLECSSEFQSLIDSLLTINQNKRPSIEEVFKIPIIEKELNKIIK